MRRQNSLSQGKVLHAFLLYILLSNIKSQKPQLRGTSGHHLVQPSVESWILDLFFLGPCQAKS